MEFAVVVVVVESILFESMWLRGGLPVLVQNWLESSWSPGVVVVWLGANSAGHMLCVGCCCGGGKAPPCAETTSKSCGRPPGGASAGRGGVILNVVA